MSEVDPSVFPFSGKAIFTIANSNTNGRFTYKVRGMKDRDIFFVSVLTGSDNENSYTFLGTIFPYGYFRSKKSTISESAPSAVAFDWFYKHKHHLPLNVRVYHCGKCGKCGRTLTTPESLLSGYGPECSRKLLA